MASATATLSSQSVRLFAEGASDKKDAPKPAEPDPKAPPKENEEKPRPTTRSGNSL